VECFLKSSRGGLVFSLEPNAVVNLEVDQTPRREKIGVKGDAPLQNMRALTSDERNVLILENTDKAPLILVGFQGHTIELEENSAAWFGFPLTQAQQELAIKTDRGIAALFSFIQNPEIPLNQFHIFVDRGNIEVNGEKLPPGASMIFPLNGQQPAEEREEKPVAPRGPKQARRGRPPREEVGSPIQP
jgi:hypothetical protein